VPSLRDSDLFPTLPSTPPSAPCWAKLFRAYGAGFCVVPYTAANRESDERRGESEERFGRRAMSDFLLCQASQL
jgi:hypothetical protein